MMLITGRIGRTAVAVAAALGLALSAAASAYASTSPCGSACVDLHPFGLSVGDVPAAGHGFQGTVLTHPFNSDPAED